MLGGRLAAEQRHRENRQHAYRAVEAELQAFVPGVSLSAISEDVLTQVDSWPALYTNSRLSHRPGWSWRKVVPKFRGRPRRIEVALWHHDVVCGLAVGRISDKRVIATIHFLESLPTGNPLKGKVAPFATRYLEAVAIGLGCVAVSIEQPVDELVEYYGEMGYTEDVKKGGRIRRLIKRLPLLKSIETDKVQV